MFVRLKFTLSKIMKYQFIDKYLIEKQKEGHYLFTYDEIVQEFHIDSTALHSKLLRLKHQHKIASIRKNFYIYFPQEGIETGSIHPYLYLDDLMHYLNINYYVALFSAASFHGSENPNPSEYYIIVDRPIKNITLGEINLNFILKKNWDPDSIDQILYRTGFINISSPELTGIDLIAYYEKIGGASYILSILKGFWDKFDSERLSLIADSYLDTSALQRLGYICDVVLDKPDLAMSLQHALESRKTHTIPFQLSSSKRKKLSYDWKVDAHIHSHFHGISK